MLTLLRPFLRTGLALGLLVWLLPTIEAQDWITVVIAGIILTILYKGIRPILKVLFLPLNVVTFGFFSVLINVGLLWLLTFLVPSFHVYPMIILGVPFGQFMSFLIVSFVISVINWLLGLII
jgi:putative membrane protein